MGQNAMLCPLGALIPGFVRTKQKLLDGEFNIPIWDKNNL